MDVDYTLLFPLRESSEFSFDYYERFYELKKFYQENECSFDDFICDVDITKGIFSEITKEQSKNDDLCAICLEYYNIDENITMCNQCKKEFHTKCVESYGKQKCPLCRFSYL